MKDPASKLFCFFMKLLTCREAFLIDLTMSLKIDSVGNLVGPYGREDLEIYWFQK